MCRSDGTCVSKDYKPSCQVYRISSRKSERFERLMTEKGDVSDSVGRKSRRRSEKEMGMDDIFV
jgi:hypothetical protein